MYRGNDSLVSGTASNINAQLFNNNLSIDDATGFATQGTVPMNQANPFEIPKLDTPTPSGGMSQGFGGGGGGFSPYTAVGPEGPSKGEKAILRRDGRG